MKYLNYLLFRFFVLVFRLIPFSIIYGISNLLAFLLNRVIKYRKGLVESNIKSTHPDFSENEIRKIIANSYRNLADIMVEGIKGMSMSEHEIKKRYKFVNPEILDNLYQNNKSVILATGHYNNWEWGAIGSSLYFEHTAVGLYKKLSNPYIESYLKRSRGKYGVHLLEISNTKSGFKYHIENTSPNLFLMVADQSPSNVERAYWVEFMGKKTACLHGVEQYSKNYNLPIVFAKIVRVKRGYYELFLSWIVEDPKTKKDGEITALFMKDLEETIKESPGNWLWSHKRWKAKYRDQKIIAI